MTIAMQWHDWLALLGQYMLLSLLSISGAITTVPDMHRYLVTAAPTHTSRHCTFTRGMIL